MAQYMCKLLTNKGDFFAAYCTVIDQFISTAGRDPSEITAQLQFHGMTIDTEPHRTFDLRRDAIHNFTLHLVKLKSGETLTDSEVIEVDNIYRFLQGTVAPHQYKYENIKARVVASIQELGLQSRQIKTDEPTIDIVDGKLVASASLSLVDTDWQEIVGDRAMFPAFQKRANDLRFSRQDSSAARPTREQNVLTGRYLSYLMVTAGLVGSNAIDVLNRFFKIMQSTPQGGSVEIEG